MNRIFEIFHRELKGVHQAALLLAFATIASNLLGLLRDRFLASLFGAGRDLDLYYASFRVADLLYAFSLFFVASTAIIPVFLEKLSKNRDDANRLMGSLFSIFSLCMLGVLGIVFVFLPSIARLMFPGFDAEALGQVTNLSRILLLSPLLLGLSNLVSSVIQSYKLFFVYALSPIFYNLGIILGILFFVPAFGLVGLVWGVVIGAALHFLIQVPSLIATGFMPRPTFSMPPEIRSIIRVSFPRTLGLTATQLAFTVITSIASTLGAGAIAVFNLAYNLQSVPLAVIGLSYSVAAFPTMAELVVKNEKKIFYEHLTGAARHIIFWTLPASVLFIVLRAQIVRTVLGAGNFTWGDTRLTAAGLAIFALGIVAQSLVVLFVRALYALGKTRLPVILNVFSAVVIVALSLFFVRVFDSSPEIASVFAEVLRVSDVPRVSVLSLPLAYSCGTILNVILLAFAFKRTEREYRRRDITISLWEIVVSSFLVGVAAYYGLALFAQVFNQETFVGIFLQGLCAGLLGIALGAGFLYMRKNKEFMEITSSFRQKFWKQETVASEPERLP